MKRLFLAFIVALFPAVVALHAVPALAQTRSEVKAEARPAPTPAWDKGIIRVTAESYWNAVECGKQGGADPRGHEEPAAQHLPAGRPPRQHRNRRRHGR